MKEAVCMVKLLAIVTVFGVPVVSPSVRRLSAPPLPRFTDGFPGSRLVFKARVPKPVFVMESSVFVAVTAPSRETVIEALGMAITKAPPAKLSEPLKVSALDPANFRLPKALIGLTIVNAVFASNVAPSQTEDKAEDYRTVDRS